MLNLRTMLHPAAPRRRSVAVAAVMAVSAVVVAGIPGSAPAAGPTTSVSFVPMPAKAIMNAAYVGPNATTSVVAIGGSTTVPTDATTIRIDVTVKGAKDGSIAIYPMGAPTPADTVAWTAGTTSTSTVMESIGLSDKISVTNSSAAAATVTLKVTGYSTQVTAAGINGSGGSPGQVLTDTGSGAAWRPASQAIHQTVVGASLLPLNTNVLVASQTVPAGAYWAMFSGDVYDTSGAMNGICSMYAPSGGFIDYTYTSTARAGADANPTVQGLVTTAGGGAITVRCQAYAGTSPYVYRGSLTVLSVVAVSGSYVSSARKGALTVPHRR